MATGANEIDATGGQQTGDVAESGEISQWNFDDWATEAGLNRKTAGALRKEDLAQKKSLCLLREEDIFRLKDVSIGQGRLLQEAVRSLSIINQCARAITPTPDQGPTCTERVAHVPPAGPVTGVDQAPKEVGEITIKDLRQQAATLGDAGKELDNWLNDNSVQSVEKCSSSNVVNSSCAHAHHHMSINDPRAILTVKATCKKALHITQFLGENAKHKQKIRRKDVILSTADDDRLVLRADESHPYSGITLHEWGAANMRLLNRLLASGELPRDHIEYYLAYTATINDFYAKFEWNSILDFDFQYREQQAQHGFPWGQINPMMELQLLIPRPPRMDTRAPPRNGKANPNQTECRQWIANNGYCRFGASCKFKHIPLNLASGNQNQIPSKNSIPPPPLGIGKYGGGLTFGHLGRRTSNR